MNIWYLITRTAAYRTAILVALLWMPGLAACGTNATPTPVFNPATAVPTHTATEALPAAVPPTTPPPTVPPATAMPQPTQTETATPEPVVPVVTELPPAPTPSGQLGPADFPPNVNPLTGKEVADPGVLDRRPMAIKVSNFPDCVRPQEGLGMADIVYEHYVEGGATRFTAIFWTNDAARVGSVRSARLIDLEIPAMYQALFGFSGASDGVKKLLEASDFFDWILSPDFVPGHPGFFRKNASDTNCDALEHTLFVNPARLREIATESGVNERPTIEGMVFNDTPPASVQPAEGLTVRYTASFVHWSYSANSGSYFRINNGLTHMDALTGTPITADNVVVIYVNHVTSDIIEDFVGYNPATGTGGSYSVQIQLWGSGDALLLRDGMLYPVKWLRQERFKPLGLTTAAGELVALKPGTTWFQIVPLDAPTEQIGAAEWQVTPKRPSAQPES